MDCDFNNDAMTCPRCGYKAGGRDWRKNCLGPSGGSEPGTELQKLIKELGFDESLGCGCAAEVNRMNSIGPARCREQIDSIVAKLEENQKLASWWQLAKAGVKAATMGIFSVRQLVEEAVRRAEGN
jgi:hypothetical protein